MKQLKINSNNASHYSPVLIQSPGSKCLILATISNKILKNSSKTSTLLTCPFDLVRLCLAVMLMCSEWDAVQSGPASTNTSIWNHHSLIFQPDAFTASELYYYYYMFISSRAAHGSTVQRLRDQKCLLRIPKTPLLW